MDLLLLSSRVTQYPMFGLLYHALKELPTLPSWFIMSDHR